MKEACFSIAGVSLRFISHGTAAKYLLAELPGLFPHFPGKVEHKSDAECLVHFDHEMTYREHFDSMPRFISGEDSMSKQKLIARMERITLAQPENYAHIIGFLNGCLIFNDRSNQGVIYIFSSAGENQFVGTMHKLMFIFTCLVMVNKERLMVHGAGIKKNEGRGGFLFLGDSGAGKSTVAALSPRDAVLSDDATVIEIAAGACRIHATPFRQVSCAPYYSQQMHCGQSKLDKVLFLHQAAVNSVQPREQRNAFTELLTRHLHCFEFMGESLKKKAFYLCRHVCETTPSYDLYFLRDHSFWELVVVK